HRSQPTAASAPSGGRRECPRGHSARRRGSGRDRRTGGHAAIGPQPCSTERRLGQSNPTSAAHSVTGRSAPTYSAPIHTPRAATAAPVPAVAKAQQRSQGAARRFFRQSARLEPARNGQERRVDGGYGVWLQAIGAEAVQKVLRRIEPEACAAVSPGQSTKAFAGKSSE